MKKGSKTVALLLLIFLLTMQIAFAAEPTINLLDEKATSSDVLPGEQDESDTPDKIPVKSIEIGEYEKEIEVDGTMTISATVRPIDATEQTITYHSSNTAVATVSSDGTVKGISAGKATISLTAGDVTEEVKIRVIVKGKTISLNQTYIILKPDTSFALKATVSPENATYSALTYKSLDKNIATVSEDGVITAHSCGTGTITVSSKDVTASVTVIVNRNILGMKSAGNESDTLSEEENEKYSIYVTSSEYPVIESSMLKYYYDNSCRLTVQCEGYQLIVDGENIRNYNNPLKTDIGLHTTEQGEAFNLNDGKSLCGEVTLLLNDSPKRLYIYNESKERYQEIRAEKNGEWKLNSAGTYLLTDENLDSHAVIWWIILSAGSVSVILLIIYVIVKKKYWFW